jgi:DNA-binding NarL/FixJ family response regulator
LPESATGPKAILLCDDLMFQSRIVGTGRDFEVAIEAVRTIAEVEALAKGAAVTCIILDLALAGPGMESFIERLRASRAIMPRLIAYGSHVDPGTLKRASDAGCDIVLPRSKFVDALPSALPEWVGIS